MFRQHQTVLVSGLHRFGNTWVKDILATAPGTVSTTEIFNVLCNDLAHDGFKFEQWFQYVSETNEAQFKRPLAGRLFRRLDKTEFTNALRDPSAREVLWRRIKNVAKHNLFRRRLVYKDPIAFFSLAWLHKAFGIKPVVLVRHPAAFAASLKRMKWKFEFDTFANQPQLMEQFPIELRCEIERASNADLDIVEDAILLWKIFEATLSKYQASSALNDDMILIKHEDISRNPMLVFRQLFDQLGLVFDEQVQRRIRETTLAQNPDVDANEAHILERNSRDNINSWRDRLNTCEIVRIRQGVEKVAGRFYEADEWS